MILTVADERELSSGAGEVAGAGEDAEGVAAETGVAWPRLDPSAIEEIAAFGSEIAVEPGQMLYRAGGEPPNFFVVLEGEVEIVREGDDEVVVAAPGPGGFSGSRTWGTGKA